MSEMKITEQSNSMHYPTLRVVMEGRPVDGATYQFLDHLIDKNCTEPRSPTLRAMIERRMAMRMLDKAGVEVVFQKGGGSHEL